MIVVVALVGAAVAVVWAMVQMEKRGGGTVSWREPVVSDESWVRVGRSMSVSEAEVALRLLESNGIRVRRVMRGPQLPPRYRAGAETRHDLLVAPDKAQIARALLRGR